MRLPTIAFDREFTHVDEEIRQDLETLERECAIYTDHWIDELEDFRHVRIDFTPQERDDFARRTWGFELFLRANCPDFASEVEGIDEDVANDADSYVLVLRDGREFHPHHSFAAFLGADLEFLVCGSSDRRTVIDLKGREQHLFDVRRTIETLTPTIRSFNNREKGLSQWNIEREDDVRDLLYVMLRPRIFDIVKEEAIPSRAGTHKFVDLCSNSIELLIEVKWIGKKKSWKRIVEQIHVDIQTYIEHPSCKDLIFAIVDSVKDIPDPRKLEAELSGEQIIKNRQINIRAIVCDT